MNAPGRIKSYSIIVSLMLQAVAIVAGDVTAFVNDCEVTESIKVNKAKTRWLFRYTRDFKKEPKKYLKSEIVEASKKWLKWKNHNNPGQNYQNGLYGTSITIPFEFGEMPKELKVVCEIGNYKDRVKRTALIEYSFDGKKFTPLVKKEYEAGKINLEKKLDLKENNSEKIWLRFKLGGQDKVIKYSNSIVFHGIDIAFAGDIKKPVEGDK